MKTVAYSLVFGLLTGSLLVAKEDMQIPADGEASHRVLPVDWPLFVFAN